LFWFRIGDLRFRLPEPVQPYTGDYRATTFGPACTQQRQLVPDFPPEVPQDAIDVINHVIHASPDSEDCEFQRA